MCFLRSGVHQILAAARILCAVLFLLPVEESRGHAMAQFVVAQPCTVIVASATGAQAGKFSGAAYAGE